MNGSETIDRLVFATVSGSQSGALVERLTQANFFVTQIDSRGGILQEATVSFLVGLGKAQLPRFLEIIRDCCQRRRQFIPAHADAPFLEVPTVMIEAEVGGAAVFVFDVERFEQL